MRATKGRKSGSILLEILDQPMVTRGRVEADGTWRQEHRRVGKNVIVLGHVWTERRKRGTGRKARKRCKVLEFRPALEAASRSAAAL
jgi:hypothetical protein